MKYVDGKVHTNGMENYWSLFASFSTRFPRCCLSRSFSVSRRVEVFPTKLGIHQTFTDNL